MSLRLIVEGCTAKVSEFLDHLKTLAPKYRFYDRSKLAATPTETRVECYFDQNPFPKPQQSKRVSQIDITTKNNINIKITLLDAVVVDLGNGNTYIHGKNFDIFASGQSKDDLQKNT